MIHRLEDSLERTVNIAEAKAHFSSLIESVAHEGERILLLSHGKPKAALVGVEDLKRLQGGLMTTTTRTVLTHAAELRRKIASRGKKHDAIEDDLEAIRGSKR
ncbi:type II toxin-antitoxin system Phd/YefM family antitoxin [Nitrospiraceae bacterium HYJII51-Mn-bac16s-1-B09]|uniref:Antitoxin n=1 Tax=Candidatus Manganitrophus noduliformans TaxID=2606439 RepID=A0A7X6IDP2_9BACT|nr:type II toxin-antitoxin system Phd/YefM family antitoxin [Candidatus Manganitrophus noduliformans]